MEGDGNDPEKNDSMDSPTPIESEDDIEEPMELECEPEVNIEEFEITLNELGAIIKIKNTFSRGFIN